MLTNPCEPLTAFKSLPDSYLEKLLSLEAEMHELNRALATDIKGRLAENSEKIHFLQQDIKAIGDTVAHTQSLVCLHLHSRFTPMSDDKIFRILLQLPR